MKAVFCLVLAMLIQPKGIGQELTLQVQEDHTRENQQQYYHHLETALDGYRSIQLKGGWEKIPSPKKIFQLGDSGEAVRKIKKRLMATGERSEKDSTTIFDVDLEKDIIGYQQRNGLKPDGKVGKETWRALNTTVEERIRQLELNMERLLQLPDALGDKYIMVNIPAFTLLAIKKEEIIIKCKIVAGKETDKTALFKGKMKYIVFAPYWNIPKSIMTKEILPAMARNPHYLFDNHMEWYDGKIRQKPGPWNALGKVKFIFPNAYNMYMHDTPSKTLFNEEKRAFSHGCIRVEQPFLLAKFLLEKEKDWDDDKIKSSMESEIELYVNLHENIPVYIVYFTAFIDERGMLNFRKDVYGRDNYLYF